MILITFQIHINNSSDSIKDYFSTFDFEDEMYRKDTEIWNLFYI